MTAYARARELNALVAATLKPPEMLGLEPDQLLRGIRARRRLSQRELAERAGLPVSTISRIESCTVSPRFDTLTRLLKAGSVALVVVDTERPYAPVVEDLLLDRLRDGAGRHVPAHLPRWLILQLFDPWWGWNRKGWFIGDGAVPTHSYEGRSRRPIPNSERWQDAT